MTYTYYPKGVCSKKMEIDLQDGIVKDLRIEAGCNGNLQGIVQLVKGNRAVDIAKLLKGIRCHSKETSCPDQLAIALTDAIKSTEEGELADD